MIAWQREYRRPTAARERVVDRLKKIGCALVRCARVVDVTKMDDEIRLEAGDLVHDARSGARASSPIPDKCDASIRLDRDHVLSDIRSAPIGWRLPLTIRPEIAEVFFDRCYPAGITRRVAKLLFDHLRCSAVAFK